MYPECWYGMLGETQRRSEVQLKAIFFEILYFPTKKPDLLLTSQCVRLNGGRTSSVGRALNSRAGSIPGNGQI